MSANKNFLLLVIVLCVCVSNKLSAQNSLTGDGFGGRSWYVATNFRVGSYSAYTVCGDSNQLYSWGANSFGQLGNGSLVPTVAAVPVLGMKNVQFYSAGYLASAIKRDSTLWVWGIGVAPPISNLPPYPVQKLTNVKFTNSGCLHSVFVKYDGTVWGIGWNNGGLGDGSINYNSPYTTPVQMTGIYNAVRAVTTGVGATIVLLADSTVMVAGGNNWFSSSTSLTAVPIPGLKNIVDIKANSYAVFTLASAGDVYALGRDFHFTVFGDVPVLGLGPANPTAIDFTPPTKMTFPPGTAPIVALSATDDGVFAMALDSNHNAYAWGQNGYGQCGTGDFIHPSTPKLVATNVIDIMAGENFSYIVKADNTLWAAGQSGYNSVQGPLTWGSIWMNLPETIRNTFTQIDPTIAPMNLCSPKPFGFLCPSTVHLPADTTLCEGQKLTLHAVLSNSSFAWQDNSTDSIYIVNSPGTYWVNATTGYCKSSDSINVYFKPLPIIQLGKDTSLCRRDELHLDATNFNASYLWQDNSTGPIYTVSSEGIYWVNVSLDGCKNADTIFVKYIDCNCRLSIPNAITPNGDAVNDKWIMGNLSCFQKVDVSVYNRYGSIVYKKENYQNDWEGTFKSKTLPDGTYYYIIKVLGTGKKTQLIKGNLTILR